MERMNSLGSNISGAMEVVGEDREMTGGGWGSAMKMLQDMEHDMQGAGPERCEPRAS
jgi:hypothetical protein